MSKVPDGFPRVRGHIRRNPKPRSAKRMSGWTIAGLPAGAWLWGRCPWCPSGAGAAAGASTRSMPARLRA